MRRKPIQKLIKTSIEIDKKITASEKLSETMILYTANAYHLLITAKPKGSREGSYQNTC
jgi:hypothetical protein